MPVISESAALSQLRERLCAKGVSNSLCPPSKKPGQESRQAINEYTPTSANTSRLPIDRPVHDIHSEKTTNRPTTDNKPAKRRREYSADPAERLIEIEVEQQMQQRNEIADIPTPVLEAELAKRRKAASQVEAVSEAELDALSAKAFGREIKETRATTETDAGEISEDELDRKIAKIFGRPVAA